MEEKVIYLSNQNYTNYLPLNPIAFSFAEGGAMGSPGQIIIIDNNRSVYNFNICDFENEIIKLIIPELLNCRFGILGYDEPALGWHNFYLGVGNHLMVKESIYNDFNSKAVKCNETPGMLYQKWIDLVLEIMKG